MHTTQEWLDKVLTDTSAMEHWLRRQFVGEVKASYRILELAARAKVEGATPLCWGMVAKIAVEELTHSQWVGDLLKVRQIPLPDLEDAEIRYWDPVLGYAKTLDQMFAAGYHAEEMRLVRIRGLIADGRTPEDIRTVFMSILQDEIGHAHVFKTYATPAALAESLAAHKAGMEALNLVD
jgi:tRNA isopentenyl-2-thiomethyl-A-37 hydroxylase MiaE